MPTINEFLKDVLRCTPDEISKLGFYALLSEYTSAQQEQIATDFAKIADDVFAHTSAVLSPIFHAVISNDKNSAFAFLEAFNATTTANDVVLSKKYCLENMDSYKTSCSTMSSAEAAAKFNNAAIWICNVLFVEAMKRRRNISLIDDSTAASIAKLEIVKHSKYKSQLSFVLDERATAETKDVLLAVMDLLPPRYIDGNFVYVVHSASLNWIEANGFTEFARFDSAVKPYATVEKPAFGEYVTDHPPIDFTREFRRSGSAGEVVLSGNRNNAAPEYTAKLVETVNSLHQQGQLNVLLATRLRTMITNWHSATPFGSPRPASSNLAPPRLLTQFERFLENEPADTSYVMVDVGGDVGKASPGTAASDASTQTTSSDNPVIMNAGPKPFQL